MPDKHRITLFLRLFCPLLILVLAGVYFYGLAEIERELVHLKSQERLNVGLGAGALNGRAEEISRDLLFLASHSALRNAINDPRQTNLDRLAEDFAGFSRTQGIYDQLRWIDETGMEVIRVDNVQGKQLVVAPEKLQNKGKRYFFVDAMKLNPGEIFVSPMDLNVEQDKIEVPYKPMLRVATPVTDAQGKKRGIVILNYYGRDMLQAFAKATDGVADHVMLLNRDGYWLKSPQAADEWGFMFKRPELSLPLRAPEAWQHIRGGVGGQLRLADGLWTWETVYPLLAGQKSSSGSSDAFLPSLGEVESSQYVWKVVAHLSSNVIDSYTRSVWSRLLVIAALLLAVFGFGCWRIAQLWTAARDSSQRLNEVIWGTRIATWEWHVQTGAVAFNERWAEIVGYTLAELAPVSITTWSALAHPDDAKRSGELLERCFKRELDRYECEARMRHKDGRWVWVEDRGRVVEWTDDGKPLRMVGTQQEITQRKQNEAELEQHRHHLLQLVEERTEEAMQARVLAEAANVAKSSFIVNMSHEIRTPMNGILGMAELMRRDGVTPAQAARLDAIHAAGQDLLSVINDILDISRIESGKLILEDAPVYVQVIVGNVCSMLSERARAKGLVLEVDFQSMPLHLRGDPMRIRQALINYVTNAIKFSESGTITVRVRLLEEDDASVLLHFEVQDAGVGIAPEARARLFSKYEQGDTSTSRRFGGGGLGLSITRRLAEMMGGAVGVESALGQGSVFWFTVRLRKESALARAASSAAPRESAEQVLAKEFEGSRLLLVEDDPIGREVALTILGEAGFKVDVAEDGDVAVSLAASADYALILMDMHLPTMDGLEATRQIRQSPTGKQVPIIALTANALAEDRQRCVASGMSDFVGKPFVPEQLFAVILKWLRREGQ